jgi:16S rRNA (adenine1518-N6/adenine1519-N6)-dimethyltransferase
LKHRARKRFGQHFLVDQSMIERIVAEIDPRRGERIVEIGPGLGALTRPLLARCGALTVIEIDRDLAGRWRETAGVAVVEADVLQVDFAALAAAWPALAPDATESAGLRIVGNLPYNISSPILFHLLPVAASIRDQHLMLQHEVVERIVAEPGGGEYGRLSVMLQWRYQVEPLLEVPPDAFDPPPRVDSAVVRMVPRRTADIDATIAPVLEQLVAVAFSQRRKLLRHTLGRWITAQPHPDRLPPFDLQRRAEEVPVEQYVALAGAAARDQAQAA